MPQRENWQIGRTMEYPYEGAKPKRQVAYVFDTNKCIACQTCTVACKTAWTSGKGEESIFFNNVETKPYGGYPLQWDSKLMAEMDPIAWNKGKLESRTIFEMDGATQPPHGHRPGAADYAQPNVGEDDVVGTIPQGVHYGNVHPVWMFYMARICNHCDNPACLAACPRKAIYKRPEDGIVLVDQSRCRGYQECVRACPYKKTFFNLVSRTSEKCIGCYPRVEQGDVALCVESCIGKIRLHGFLTSDGAPREDNPLDYIIKIRKLALPLYPHFGTGPNVYYIPPIHVPEGSFMDTMFGPGVKESKAMYRNLKNDPQLLGALLLFGSTNRILTRFKVEGQVAIGYDVEDKEVARVPFTEPMIVRPAYDEKFDVARNNTA